MVDAHYQVEANHALVLKFLEGLSAKMRCGMNGASITTEIIPYCVWLLSAGKGNNSLNRAVSSIDILNNHEKEAFQAHVATLRALGLTYVKDDTERRRHEHEMGVLRLEPDIESVTRFKDLVIPKGSKRRSIPSAVSLGVQSVLPFPTIRRGF